MYTLWINREPAVFFARWALFAAVIAASCADTAPPTESGADVEADVTSRRGSEERDTATTTPPADLGIEDSVGEIDVADLSSDEPIVADVVESDESEESCVQTTASAEPILTPVDIILFVDTSTSMEQEADKVEEHMDDLARFISTSGIDYRVILLAEDDEVCMPSPPSGGGCPDADSATYLHVRHKVGSKEGFTQVVDRYSDYQSFLRPGAQVHIIGVTDDNDDETAAWFEDEMALLSSPGFPDGFTFHAIVAQGDLIIIGCCGLTGCGAGIGTHYLTLARSTGGVSASMCTGDWAAVFAAIASSVVDRVGLPCSFVIPDPGVGLEVDPDRINVYLTTPALGRVLLPNLPDEATCRDRGGWYFDDPERPTAVHLCSALCETEAAEVDIQFGCETVKE